MYVRRLRLLGVKVFHGDFPRDGQPFPEPTRRRLLLQGGNGSGKTTLLEAIRALWESFGVWIDLGPHLAASLDGMGREGLDPNQSLLSEIELAAMELGDFPDPGRTFWIGTGQENAWEELKRQHPEADFAGLVRSDQAQHRTRLELSNPDRWKTFRQRSMVGAEPQVNIVYISSENRTVAATPEGGARLIDTTALNWSAVYSPKIDLDSLLLTIKALRPQAYEETVRLTNMALRYRNKQILGFGDNGRLVIEGRTDSGATYQHPTEELSSGERQFLLLVAWVVGFLRPGGIVLIEEPDLFVHFSLSGLLMEIIDHLVVRERRGQLIVASQSQRVWDWFPRDAEKIDLTPWRGGQ